MKFIKNPNIETLGSSVEEFLQILGGPTALVLKGVDSSRCRALVTLLHGNEPSGIKALFRWLQSGSVPAVDIVCIIASVQSALKAPTFSHRMLPGTRDLNRCFNPPYQIDEPGLLSQDILKVLHEYQPEAVVDMHNTSGSGPAFGVATFMDDTHDALVSVFAQRLIVTDLRLGALMEISESLCPTITIETGGRLDPEADEIAWDGMQRYFRASDVLTMQATDWGLELLHNPIRLEFKDDTRLCFGETADPNYDLTLGTSIEHHNFGVVPADTLLGWTDVTPLNLIFQAKNISEQCVLDQLLYLADGQLLTRQNLMFFMITTNPLLALSDCLCYIVKSDGQEIIAT